MSESYPHFDFESHDDKSEKSPKRDRPAGKIERPIGRMATPLEHRVPLKPLGDLTPKQEKRNEDQKPLPSASEYHVAAESPNWRRPEPGELTAMAEQAQRTRLEASMHEFSGDDENSEAKTKSSSVSKSAEKEGSGINSTESNEDEPDGSRRINDASLYHYSGASHEISEGRYQDGSPPDHGQLGPEVEHNPHLPSDNEANFQAIVNQPEIADLAARQIPETPRLPVDEQAQPAAFNEWVRQDHPELTGPEMAAASNPDEGFNDIVRQNYGEGMSTGPTRYHEQAPGEPPIDAGNGGANLPPNLPTAEGGAWGSPSAWERPAGGLGGPAALAGMSAMEARRHLDNLRHTAAEFTLAGGEAALAGAIGVLGLALAAEHIRAKHREKKLGRQLNQQSEELNRTNQALAVEQVRHTQTREQLNRLYASQQSQLSANKLAVPATEVAAGAGLIGTVTGSVERKSNSGNQSETSRNISDQELAYRLKHSRELGRAIQRNPEMRDTAQGNNHELRELVEASAYADSLKRERNYEHLQAEPTDNAGQARSGNGSDTAGTDKSIGLPHPSNPVLPSPHSLGSPAAQYQNKDSKSKTVKPIAAATVLVIVVLILIFIFG